MAIHYTGFYMVREYSDPAGPLDTVPDYFNMWSLKRFSGGN